MVKFIQTEMPDVLNASDGFSDAKGSDIFAPTRWPE